MHRRGSRGLGWLCVVTGMLFLATVEATAECETGGLSGTGLSGEGGAPATGTGTGGTGRGDESGTGTGGTGLGDPHGEGTGTGGTGFLGVVTGFGSVCVNGAKVEYDAETRIFVDGQLGMESDLAIGQLVRITTRASQPAHARDIRVQNVLVGPIDRVSRADKSFWVMGQRVVLRNRDLTIEDRGLSDARGAVLPVGARVAVSGFRRGDGVVTATRVDRAREGRPAQATAVVGHVSDRVVVVGDVRAELSEPRGAEPTQLVGRRVRVNGNWNADTDTLERATIVPADSLDRDARRVSIQGYVTPGTREKSFRIDDVEIDGRAVASDLEGLGVDSRIRVEGDVEGRGRVRAKRVVVEETGRRERIDGLSAESAQDRKGRGDRSDREERSDRSGRSGRSERGDRPERVDRSGRSGRSDRSNR